MFGLSLLGGFELTGPDGVVDLPSKKLVGLLTYLACSAPRPQSREKLSALLWGSHFDVQAKQNLRQALFRLRKVLGENAIESDGDVVSFNAAAILCDVRRFETLVREGSCDALSGAADLYRGRLIDDVTIGEEGWNEWLTGERDRLRELALGAMVGLGKQELAAGRPERALKAGRRAIALNNIREDAHRLVVLALAATGRKAEALRHYQDLVALLKHELNTEPDAATRSLVAKLRSTQPSNGPPFARRSTDLAPAQPERPSISVVPVANMRVNAESPVGSIAAPSPAEPVEAFLAIVLAPGFQEHRSNQHAIALAGELRDMIAADLGADRNVIVAENGPPAADRLRYVLHVGFHAENGRLNCAVTLREMPSKRIVKAFGLPVGIADATPFAGEAARISNIVIGALQQALADASVGLGTPTDAPPGVRLQNATSLLSVSNPKWLASGEQLRLEREQNPSDADTALQWCLHLFARLVHTSPFKVMSLEERERTEREIEATVLECLPVIEANPVLNLAAAKLLYFIGRGHLELAEDLAERAFARTSDFAAALPILGQLRGTRGNFEEAVILFDRGIEMPDITAGFLLHMQVLKCTALLASGDRAALDAVASVIDLSRDCPPEIALMIRLMIAPAGRELPAALAQALAAVGPSGAVSVIEYVYFTGARQLTSKAARANVMRGLVAHVTSLHGGEFVPTFVLESTGLARQPEHGDARARQRALPSLISN
jgi:DNA-binding SARP family transcriptional activator